jgi:voltage-gated potassium channel Kch
VPSVALLTGVIHDIQQWLDHERGVGISAEAVTVTHLTLYTAFVTIWMTVGWCILHFHGAQQNNWISALYWCLTSITTTGYGDITPVDTRETVYNILYSIVGPTIFATIIAKFASYVKK